MTKAELAEQVSEKIGLTRKETECIINAFCESIVNALEKGDKVEIRGFGSFRVRHRASRSGRNPKTGESVQVPPKKVPFFKAGLELKGMVDKVEKVT